MSRSRDSVLTRIGAGASRRPNARGRWVAFYLWAEVASALTVVLIAATSVR
jgi:hypothetical protein